MSNQTFTHTSPPSKVLLLLKIKQLENLGISEGIVDRGFDIIPLTKYDSCTYQYSKILRVGTSRSKLKRWLRTYTFKENKYV